MHFLPHRNQAPPQCARSDHQGQGTEEDLVLLETLSEDIREGALCGLGKTAPNPVITSLRYFREEYEAHVREKRCPPGSAAR